MSNFQQQQAAQQFVQGQQPQGGGWNTPQQQTGVPQQPQAPAPAYPQQNYGRMPSYGYSPDHLPPPRQQQQTFPQGGVPGTQIQQPYTPQQPQGYAPQQQAPQGYAPQQQGFQPQQPQQPQGQNFGQPPQQAPQQQNRVQLDDNLVLDGPGVPNELRGRTWGEARRLYSALSNDWLQRNRRPATPAQQTLQSMQPQGQQPQGVVPQQGQHPQQTGRPAGFWQNPDERIAEVVRQQIESTVLPQLQPIVQSTQAQAIQQARQIASTGMPDFQTLEADVMEMLASANPQDLANPQVWIAAADMARGRRVASGQYQPSQQRQQIPGQQNGGFQGGPGVSQPAQPLHQFFTEGPTVPQSYANGPAGQQQPSQADYAYAQRFGMSIGDYMAYKHGVGSQQAGVR